MFTIFTEGHFYMHTYIHTKKQPRTVLVSIDALSIVWETLTWRWQQIKLNLFLSVCPSIKQPTSLMWHQNLYVYQIHFILLYYIFFAIHQIVELFKREAKQGQKDIFKTVRN